MIIINNYKTGTVSIDIEGTIGVPEEWQFEDPAQRVATYERFRSSVEALKAVEAERVVVNIRSTGGNVNDALLIFDALKSLGLSVTTRCYGYVASAATVIAQAADEGCREVSRNSLYLIHRSMSAVEGNSQELSRQREVLLQTDRRLIDIYALRSGRSPERIEALMDENDGNGRWLSPEEAVEAGLADRIVDAAAVSAEAAEEVSHLGLPPLPASVRKGWMARIASMIDGLRGVRREKPQSSAAPEEVAEPEIATPEANAAPASDKGVLGLDAREARLAARATSTEPREDPSSEERRLSPNEAAYMGDMRSISMELSAGRP